MSTAMKPTAEGTFQKTPLANVLLYSRERKMTGSLVITIQPETAAEMAALDVAGLSTLVLEQGAIVAVQTPAQGGSLSAVLRDRGDLTDDEVAAVQHALQSPSGTDEVSTLLRLGLADMKTIERGIHALSRRRVLALFGHTRGSYAYYGGVDLLGGADRLRAPEDVLAVVWQSFRSHPPDDAAVAGIVEKLGARALRLRDGSEFDRFEFGDELGLAPTQLRSAPSALEQLAGLAPDPSLVRRMVYLLALTKQVEVAPTASAPPAQPALTVPPVSPAAPAMTVPPRPPPIPPSAVRAPTTGEQLKATPPPAPAAPSTGVSSPEIPIVPPPRAATPARVSSPDIPIVPAPRAGSSPTAPPQRPSSPAVEKPDVTLHPKYKEAKAHLARLEHRNYFEMFDLPVDAPVEEVRAAFPRIAATWHPDRAPVTELQPVFEEVFALYNTAYTTLTQKDARAHYLDSLNAGGGTPASLKQVAAVLDTVQDVHRAEILVKRRDFAEAERVLRRVLAASADDVAAILLLAQCLIELDPTRYAEEVIGFMAKVMQATEGNDRSRFLLGVALKAKGDLPRARACFKQALEMNPNNIEATRELRIIEMRLQQRKDEKAAQNSPFGGLFNKLMKK